ncbi:MAG: hypothetical protein ABI114_00460 [Rhodanobacter sp.]
MTMPVFKPLADAMPDGRIAVYVGAAYQYITRENARVFIDQLHTALAAGQDTRPGCEVCNAVFPLHEKLICRGCWEKLAQLPQRDEPACEHRTESHD